MDGKVCVSPSEHEIRPMDTAAVGSLVRVAPVADVEVFDDVVYVHPKPRQASRREHYLRRLREGMEQDIGLIQAKSLIGLLEGGADYRELVRAVALFGVSHREDWASGLTILTAMA